MKKILPLYSCCLCSYCQAAMILPLLTTVRFRD